MTAEQEKADPPRSKYLLRRSPCTTHEPDVLKEEQEPQALPEEGGRIQRATSYADRRLPAAAPVPNVGPRLSSDPTSPVSDRKTEPLLGPRKQPYLLRRRQGDFRWVEFDGRAPHTESRTSGARLSIHGRGSHAFLTAESMMSSPVSPVAMPLYKPIDALEGVVPEGNPSLAKHWEPVLLNIYDLGDSKTIQRLNVVLKSMGSGAYHAAVQVYGQEWSFGGLSIDDPVEEGFETGIWSCRPQGSRQHSYRESLDMGHTALSHVQVLEVIQDMMYEWPMNSYQILRRNCCHFCEALCKQLGVGPVPSWVLNLAGVGASLENVQTSTLHATVSAASAVRDLAMRVRKK